MRRRVADDLIGYGPFDTHQIAYTFTGGNGFTAAVALEQGGGSTVTPFGFEPTSIWPGHGDLYTLDDYVPHVVGGVGWTGGWGGVSVVAGYDAVWEEGAIKGRVDFNVGDAISIFVMAAWLRSTMTSSMHDLRFRTSTTARTTTLLGAATGLSGSVAPGSSARRRPSTSGCL